MGSAYDTIHVTQLRKEIPSAGEPTLAGGFFPLVQHFGLPLVHLQHCPFGLPLVQLQHWGREMDMPWKVEGVNFSPGENAGEEVVSLAVLCLDKYYPLLWCSF